MRTLRPVSLALAVAVAFVLSCSDPTSPEDLYDTWGATGVQLVISLTDAMLTTSCRAGRVTMPMSYGEGGRFTGIATLSWQGGAGPGAGSDVVASLSGRLRGDRISLTITPENLGLGPYELERGRVEDIPGCP
jgi:hypothetical protein